MNAPAEVLVAPLVVDDPAQLTWLDLGSLRPRETPDAAIMCRPTYYGVEQEINDFMIGNIGTVEDRRAKAQWSLLRAGMARQGLLMILDGEQRLPDMVFAANAALTWRESGRPKRCIMSRMKYDCRQGETPFFEKHLREWGYEVITLSDNVRFEGQGDALWHPGKMLLWGGYGHRSDRAAYREIAEKISAPVITLELVSKFYHLDTCFCPLDEQTVLYYPDAFSRKGRELIQHMFKESIAVSRKEAENFACNSVVRGKDVIMPECGSNLPRALAAAGFQVFGIEMSEFLKSGGAARCLVLDYHRR